MANTIQLWIDLWTTNSAIVVDYNGKIEVIKNSDQLEYTPSVFWYRWKNVQVWKKAYDQLFQFSDEDTVENYKAEIKRLMWTPEKVSFETTGENLSAEEISAEILKYLKECALRKYPDLNTDWVVITVPAYFTTTQKEATTEAWKLAWFKHVVLMQEPIAWAMAYWFDKEVNENWLVYDLWWWTFDVAIISSKDWTLTVKWHAWDNYLWGKDFDSLIVNKIILPLLENKYELSHTLKDEKKKKALLNRLKYAAELAKKDLTDYSTTAIQIDNIKDDDGEYIEETIDFSKEDFEELISKKVFDSIKLCKDAIEESWLSKANINKVILVWWSTLTPYIRETIEKELGILVDSSVDPLTVVAKWACIFGRSQIIPNDVDKESPKKKASTNSATITLNYEPVTSDTEAMITWIVHWINTDENYYIQIQSEDSTYSSSKLKLKNWKFFDEVTVRKWQANQYFIYLSDEQWNIIDLDNDSFVITHWVSVAWVPISYSVSVALRKKSLLSDKEEEYCEVLFEKWLTLPVEKTVTYHTAKELKKWDTENCLPIRIYEWESKKSDRNQLICELILRWTDIPFSLPEGTEVDLTIKMDVSGNVSVSAYFSDIDYYIENMWRTHWDEEISSKQMKNDIESEQKRFNSMKKHLSENDKSELNEMFDEVEEQTDSDDEDTKRKANAWIKKIKMKLDKFEEDTEWDEMIEKYNEKIQSVKDLAKEIDWEDIIEDELNSLTRNWKEAIENKDRESLENTIEELQRLIFKVMYNTPKWLKALLANAYNHRHEAIDVVRVNQIFERAAQYMDSNNVSWMQNCLQAVWDLMPSSSNSTMWWIDISWITK